MTTREPKFRTPTGRLTRYSFACGYIENKSTDPTAYRESDLHTELYHDGACYHVRQFDRRPGAESFRVMWESFNSLRDARRLFDLQPGEMVRKG